MPNGNLKITGLDIDPACYKSEKAVTDEALVKVRLERWVWEGGGCAEAGVVKAPVWRLFTVRTHPSLLRSCWHSR